LQRGWNSKRREWSKEKEEEQKPQQKASEIKEAQAQLS
jgi:hypothetical protein